MHEVSLCQNVISQLQIAAERENFSRVTRIWLEIGTLSHVTEAAMRFAFDAVAKGTIATRASLEIRSIPAQGRCERCHRMSAMIHRYDPCSGCGHFPLTVVGGEELRIKNIEVE